MPKNPYKTNDYMMDYLGTHSTTSFLNDLFRPNSVFIGNNNNSNNNNNNGGANSKTKSGSGSGSSNRNGIIDNDSISTFDNISLKSVISLQRTFTQPVTNHTYKI